MGFARNQESTDCKRIRLLQKALREDIHEIISLIDDMVADCCPRPTYQIRQATSLQHLSILASSAEPHLMDNCI